MFQGLPLTIAGTYSDTLISISGCDSIVTLDLSVGDYIRHTIDTTICEGSSYTFNGIQYTTSQFGLPDTFSTLGCDSIVMLNLTVHPVPVYSFSETICQGDTFWFRRMPLTVSGIYSDTLTATSGCDSIVVLSISVLPATAYTFTESICAGDTFVFQGRTLTIAGAYSDTLIAGNGCDSIVTLQLLVNDYIRYTIDTSVCDGIAYEFNGVQYTMSQSGLTDTFPTAGCDSIVILNLTVLSTSVYSFSESICSGDTFLFAGMSLSVTGTYADTLLAAGGCDSIVVLNLSVGDYIRYTIDTAICEGVAYEFNGRLYTTAQVGLQDIFSTLTCDSIVTLNLSVMPVSIYSFSESICMGDTFLFHGASLTATGSYSDTLTSISGCDSVIILNLTVHPAVTYGLADSICTGDTFIFNGKPLISSGTYSDTLTSISGCDSIITLNLNVRPAFSYSFTERICTGNTFLFHGMPLGVTGVYSDTLISVSGCDSIVTLHLAVDDYIRYTIDTAICNGSVYEFKGIQYTTSQTGLSDTFSTAQCDSIVTLNLTVLPMAGYVFSESICAGDSFLFHGASLTTSGTYIDTLVSAIGCDSIVTLQLTVSDYTRHTLDTTVCAGSVYEFKGTQYTTSQTGLLDTFSTSGCDSIVTLNLTVLPVFEHYFSANVCSGDTFSFHGILLTIGGIYSDTLVATSGCDSVVILNLTIHSNHLSTEAKAICHNELPYLWNGRNVFSAGSRAAVYNGQSINGCDSIIHLDLIVQDPPQVMETDSLICNGNSGYHRDTVISDTLFGYLGCDSIIRIVNITVLSPSFDKLRIDTFACDQLIFEDSVYYGNTVLTDILKDRNGCDSVERTVYVHVENFRLSLLWEPEQPYKGELVHFKAYSPTYPFYVESWYPYDWFPDQKVKEQRRRVMEETEIWVTGRNERGCTDTARITLEVLPYTYDVFMPNAFSPNGDGINDLFSPVFYANSYRLRLFRIFDRWGNCIYYSVKDDAAWDGNYNNGMQAEVGTYNYYLEVEFADGEKQSLKGDLQLIR